jgi:hypothetical protein
VNRATETTLFLAAGLALAAAATAQKPHNRPELFAKLIDCRGIADNVQRLACYDQSVEAIEEAEKKKDIVVVDRKEMRETRKSLFGFTLPRIGLFGGDKEDEKDEVREISSTVELARPTRGGDWSLRLADDAGTWETNSPLTVEPRAGDKVRIKKASMGSYLGSVGISRGVRFRRVQ